MGNPGSRGSSGEKNRTYLLLSLILLVWNTAATARFVFEGVPPPAPGSGTSIPPDAFSPDNRSAPVSPGRPSLTLRQKYLVGNRLDINRATEEEISELPWISDEVAAAVVAERHRRGGFRSPRELLSVRGIKRKRLEKILPFLSEMENN